LPNLLRQKLDISPSGQPHNPKLIGILGNNV
jgi:hypothetical protein